MATATRDWTSMSDPMQASSSCLIGWDGSRSADCHFCLRVEIEDCRFAAASLWSLSGRLSRDCCNEAKSVLN